MNLKASVLATPSKLKLDPATWLILYSLLIVGLQLESCREGALLGPVIAGN